MKRYRLRLLPLILSGLMLVSCAGSGDTSVTEADSAVTETASSAASSAASSSVPSSETADTSAPSESPEETESVEGLTESGQASEEVRSSEVRSFGKLTEPFVAQINQQTLENEGSGLFDVLGDLSSLSAERTIELIEAYSLPDKAYYGDEPVTELLRDQLSEERNLGALGQAENFEIRFGILTDNADVRGYPTALRATDTGGEQEYDYFQETKLLKGSGVLVLHISLSGEYCFVQGYNYNGWVRSADIGFCDYDAFTDYLTPDRFLVCVKPDQETSERRLGEVLPISSSDDSGTAVLVPETGADGELVLRTELITPDILREYYHEGFLSWSEDSCVELMRSLIGFPYGWGDTDNAYDCSSTIGSVYACFGFVLPRNTGIMKYFGVHSEDVEGKSYEELRELIASHPSAILIFKGHALMSTGIRTRDDGSEYLSIVHNTKGWYTSEGDSGSYQYKWCVTDSCPEEMFRADGTLTLDYLTRIIWVE